MYREIYCCGCQKEVVAKLTDGKEIYPHRFDLANLPFWICVMCGNYVGCHHKTGNPTKPLGNIPTAEMRSARSRIHAVLDPLWKSGRVTRKHVYARLSETLGRQYHTAELRTVDEAQLIFQTVKQMADAPRP